MMNANELRINNWVEYEGRYFQLYAIDANMPFLNTAEFGVGVVDYNNIFPIPLSPEMIEKFDFSERYNSGVSSNKDHFILLINSTRFYFRPSYQGGFYWGIVDKDIDNPHEPNDCIPLQSLHQFQNWYFIMAGEELTYKQ